jgi:hypothetical protein
MLKLQSIMYKAATAMACFALLTTACKKKEEPNCGYRATVSFKAPGTSDKTYIPYIDGIKQTDLPGGQTLVQGVDTGCHTLTVGSITDTVCLKPCEAAVFIIR